MKQNLTKIRNFIIDNLKWVVLFICIVSFLAIVEDVMDKDIMKLDEKGYQQISDHLIFNRVTPVAKIITNFGGTYWLIGISVLFLIVMKDKRIGISIVANLGLATVINYTLKQILQRPRPTEYRLIDERGYSLPSGHSMVSMAFYGYLIYLTHQHVKNEYLKRGIIGGLSILIICIGLSRIYLGVHYTSDVLAGFLIAISYLIVYIHCTKSIVHGREEAEE